MEGVEGNEEEASNASLVPLLALSCFPELNRIALIRQKKDAIYLFYMRLWSTKGCLSFLMTILNSICKTSRLTRRNSSYLSASSSKKGLATYIHSCASSDSCNCLCEHEEMVLSFHRNQGPFWDKKWIRLGN
jgi:hypothetical protein